MNVGVNYSYRHDLWPWDAVDCATALRPEFLTWKRNTIHPNRTCIYAQWHLMCLSVLLYRKVQSRRNKRQPSLESGDKVGKGRLLDPSSRRRTSWSIGSHTWFWTSFVRLKITWLLDTFFRHYSKRRPICYWASNSCKWWGWGYISQEPQKSCSHLD